MLTTYCHDYSSNGNAFRQTRRIQIVLNGDPDHSQVGISPIDNTAMIRYSTIVVYEYACMHVCMYVLCMEVFVGIKNYLYYCFTADILKLILAVLVLVKRYAYKYIILYIINTYIHM